MGRHCRCGHCSWCTQIRTLPPAQQQTGNGAWRGRGRLFPGHNEQEIIPRPKPYTMLNLHTSTEKIYLIRRKINVKSQVPIGPINVPCHSDLHLQKYRTSGMVGT